MTDPQWPTWPTWPTLPPQCQDFGGSRNYLSGQVYLYIGRPLQTKARGGGHLQWPTWVPNPLATVGQWYSGVMRLRTVEEMVGALEVALQAAHDAAQMALDDPSSDCRHATAARHCETVGRTVERAAKLQGLLNEHELDLQAVRRELEKRGGKVVAS